jgi:hypothetical protein
VGSIFHTSGRAHFDCASGNQSAGRQPADWRASPNLPKQLFDGLNGSLNSSIYPLDRCIQPLGGCNGSFHRCNRSLDRCNQSLGGCNGSLDRCNRSLDRSNQSLGGCNGSLDRSHHPLTSSNGSFKPLRSPGARFGSKATEPGRPHYSKIIHHYSKTSHWLPARAGLI